MKNYYFSLILFISLCCGAVFSNHLATAELNRYMASFIYFSKIENVTDYEHNKIADLKHQFEKKKNMLQLIISKEHIHRIETNILLIENSIENNDISEIQSKSIESTAILKQMKEYLTIVN